MHIKVENVEGVNDDYFTAAGRIRFLFGFIQNSQNAFECAIDVGTKLRHQRNCFDCVKSMYDLIVAFENQWINQINYDQFNPNDIGSLGWYLSLTSILEQQELKLMQIPYQADGRLSRAHYRQYMNTFDLRTKFENHIRNRFHQQF